MGSHPPQTRWLNYNHSRCTFPMPHFLYAELEVVRGCMLEPSMCIASLSHKGLDEGKALNLKRPKSKDLSPKPSNSTRQPLYNPYITPISPLYHPYMKTLKLQGCTQLRGFQDIWGFPKIRGTILGVPIIRIIVYWGLH